MNSNPPSIKTSTNWKNLTERRNWSVCVFLLPVTVGNADFVDNMKERIGLGGDVATPCRSGFTCMLHRTRTSLCSGSLSTLSSDIVRHMISLRALSGDLILTEKCI